jgi:zinc protease
VRRLGSSLAFTFSLLALHAVAAVDAQQQPDLRAEAPIPADSRVTVGTLENGLTYYVRANQRPEQRAELRLVIDVGSILEDEDQRGLAHVLEHMAFNGTRNFERQELVRYLESIGMRFGPDVNASTSFDETIYMLTVPTDDPQILATAFQILEDWASGIVFDPEEIEKERDVVIEEWRGRRGAAARVQDLQFPVLLHGSRYAERLPIGSRETLETFTHEALIRFYERWYRPDLMAVVAVGDFDPEEIERLIHAHFAHLPVPAVPADRPLYPVPPHPETLFHVARDPELTTTRIEVIHKLPRRHRSTVGDYRGALIERLYGSMLNTRFQEITQRPNAPFLAAGAGSGSYVRTADAYLLQAIVADAGVERGLEALLTEAERVARHGFTPTELERQKLNLLRSLERGVAERERTNSAAYVNAYVRNYLSGTPIPGVDFEFAVAEALLPEIAPEEVNRLAREILTEANRVVLVSGPEKADLPAPGPERLREVVAAVTGSVVEPYEDGTVDHPLLGSAPNPGTILEETYHPEAEVLDWRLSNGARVLLKQTDFRNDEVLFRAFASGGTSLASDEEYLTASLASTFANASGVGPFSAVDLGRALAGKAVSIAPLINELEQGLTGSASPRDLETLLQLVYLNFTEPREDPEATAAIVEQIQALLVNRSADPATAFSDTFTVTYTRNHPRARPLTVSDLARIDVAGAHAFFRDRFSDAAGFTFVFVGNIEPEGLRPLVEAYLGGLPSSGRTESWRDVGLRPPVGRIEKVVRQGVEPRASTRIAFSGTEAHTPEKAHLLRSLASALNIRLRDVLREDLGGTYGVQVSSSFNRRPIESYALHIAFGAAPERLEELVAALFEELERFRREGPSESDVANVREIQRRERESGLRTNGFWIDQISNTVRAGGDFGDILDFDSLAAQVTREKLRDAARDWLQPENYVRVSLYPAQHP